MNSVARIASPSGTTMNAGPGVTIITTPTSSTLIPSTKMISRRTAFTSDVPYAAARPSVADFSHGGGRMVRGEPITTDLSLRRTARRGGAAAATILRDVL